MVCCAKGIKSVVEVIKLLGFCPNVSGSICRQSFTQHRVHTVTQTDLNGLIPSMAYQMGAFPERYGSSHSTGWS